MRPYYFGALEAEQGNWFGTVSNWVGYELPYHRESSAVGMALMLLYFMDRALARFWMPATS
jgi:hypothetical protein